MRIGAWSSDVCSSDLVTGLPGISIPTTRKALLYRRQADLVVLHSPREVREFGRLSHAKGWDHRFGLATLPFVSPQHASGTDPLGRASCRESEGQYVSTSVVAESVQKKKTNIYI